MTEELNQQIVNAGEFVLIFIRKSKTDNIVLSKKTMKVIKRLHNVTGRLLDSANKDEVSIDVPFSKLSKDYLDSLRKQTETIFNL